MFAYARRLGVVGCLALFSALWGIEPGLAGAVAMRLNGYANAPVGYVDFCRSFPAECTARGGEGAEPLTEERWRDLLEVNSFVNHVVIPATDLEFYRRPMATVRTTFF